MRRQPRESITVYLERLKDQACQVFEGLADNESLFFDHVKDKFLESAWASPTAATLVEVMRPHTWAALRRPPGRWRGICPRIPELPPAQLLQQPKKVWRRLLCRT